MFLVGNWWVVWNISPLERGLKGCVTVGGAAWTEMFAKLLGYVAYVVISGAVKYLSASGGCF